MELLTELFPPQNFALLGVILLLPLLGAFVNGIFGKRLGREAVSLLGLSVIFAAFVGAVITYAMLLEHGHDGGAPKFQFLAWNWLELQGSGAGMALRVIPLDVAFSVDPLSGTMVLVITGIGFLIHLYSSSYMAEDPGFYRFFAYLNLFIFSMLVLVLGDSLPILFVGWEGVGLCSYLLIGFWFGEDANASAGKKAFITNRIGDFGLLVAMGLLVYYVGALDWSGIDAGKGTLLQAVKIWPVGDEVPIARLLPGAIGEAINQPRFVSAATLVCLALFLGAMGKSAQFGLHVWLPDAMAGPTPVSALIHAATMVTAGVYLVCRLSGVFVLSPMAMAIVAGIGAFTALFAATIALVQNDIKKVLAYSTLSQLGYMFLGAGVGAFEAGFFHVLTHACFKACLFLGAGSVIHAMHARIHDTESSQDMRNMGGLWKFMPATALTFVAAWAAIAGVPGTSGFFSKDEILLMALTSRVTGPATISGGPFGAAIENFVWPEWYSSLLYGMGFLTAVLTAFYMSRLVIGIFLGEFRGWKIVPDWVDPHAAHAHAGAAHAELVGEHDAHGHDAHGDEAHAEAHDDHAHEAPGVDNMDGPLPHESPWQMTLPLWILGGLSIVAGLLNAHLIHLAPLGHFLEPVFAAASKHVEVSELAHSFEWTGAALAVFGACAPGVAVAYWMYVKQGGAPARELAVKFRGVYSFLQDKWRIDEFYAETVIGALDALADMCVWFDKYIVDGILARFSAFLVQLAGSLLRQFQTGRVQAYAAMTVLGTLCFGIYFALPHAEVYEVFDESSGSYKLSAAPGLGYKYRWDIDGESGWDKGDKFNSQTEVAFQLKPDEQRKVKLEVEGPFLVTSSYERTIVRPRGVGGTEPQGGEPARPRARLTPKAPPIVPGAQVPPGHPPLPGSPTAAPAPSNGAKGTH
jgi:NADH-quinone oxidoreductase subunit L